MWIPAPACAGVTFLRGNDVPARATQRRLFASVVSGPHGEDGFDFLDFLAELLNLADAASERHGVAGGAEADGLIRVVHGLGEDGDAAKHEALKFLAGKVGGLFADASQLGAEFVVFEPTVEGAIPDAGFAGGLSHGGSGGNDGQDGLLAKGEAGFLDFPLIFSHFVPFRGLCVGLRKVVG